MTSQQFSLRLRNAVAGIAVHFVLIFAVAWICTPAVAGDWPTHRFDGRRSAVTTENIGPELYPQWVFHSPHTPKPAWPSPAEEMPRMHSDSTCNVVVADGKVYFASATAGKVNCIDLASGKANWSFFTDGPVRFTPSVRNGRVYFGSDDGYVYCLDAKSGEPIWKYRAGPSDEKVIGNGQMISLWPVRTSVIVDDRQVLFAAGVFPYEGIYVCALDPSDGSVIWRNDTVGDRAHELDFGGMSPHGYLVASGDIVYVPSGRALPAAFSRKDGKFLFFTRVIGKHGGAWTMLAGDKLLAGVDMSGRPQKAFFNAATGASIKNSLSRIPAIDMVASGETFYALTEDGIQQVGQEGNKGRWQYKRKDLSTLVLAGYTLLAGGKDFVVAVDTETGSEIWRHDISGTAVGLAVADGRLIVSTDSGKIHCFSDRKNNAPIELRSAPLSDVFPKDSLTPLYERIARQIVDDCGITKGYALVLDCGTGRLAFELAKNTDLQIIGLENNPDKLRLAREKLDAAGLLGTRIVVQSWKLDDLPEYFANLIVSDSMFVSGKTGVSKQQAHRLLRPYGGTAYWGHRSISDKFVRGELAGAGEWTQQFANAQNTACSNDDLVAGPLGILWYGEPGPQGMIERHADAASPVSVEGRMFVQGEHRIMAVDAYNGTVLWDRELPGAARMLAKADSGNLVANTDGLYLAARAKCYRLDPATGDTVRIYTMPPSKDKMPKRWGYVSVQGNILYGSAAEAMDNDYGSIVDVLVENGKWKDKEQIPEDYISVYETTVKKYPVPDEDFLRELERTGGLWKPMRPRPRGGEFTIKGAVTGNVTVSDQVFALDTETGKLLWTHRANRIADTTITIGDGKLFLTRLDASPQQKKLALKEQIRLAADGRYLSRTDITQHLDSNKKRLGAIGDDASSSQTRKFKYMIDTLQAELELREGTLNFDDYDIRTVAAIDAVTGRKLWEKVFDLTGCGGDAMGSALQDGKVLFFGNHGNHDAWRHQAGGMEWRRITVLNGKDGELIWSRPLNYRTRPVIVGDKIIIEPKACDLATGEIVMRQHPVSGEKDPWEFLRPGHTCALISASSEMLFYRSSCIAIYDMAGDRGVTLFGGYRPGCAINMIPAGGVLLSPEASAGCTCSYPLRCSFALVRKPARTQPWSVFISSGDMKPVSHFAVNLGAVADMKDDNGTVWFGYPNPMTNYLKNHYPDYGMKFDLREQIAASGYFAADHKGRTIAGTDRPWLFTSGCLGMTKCLVALDAEDASTRKYTVRLGFMPRPGDRAGQRVFDIKLQDRIVARNFDPYKDAGGPDRAVIKEFGGISATDALKIELLAGSSTPAAKASLINFIEVVKEYDGK